MNLIIYANNKSRVKIHHDVIYNSQRFCKHDEVRFDSIVFMFAIFYSNNLIMRSNNVASKPTGVEPKAPGAGC